MILIFAIFMVLNQMLCEHQLEKIPDMGLVWETSQDGFCIATVKHPKSGLFIMEIWKDIKDYEGLYRVSNYGRVKSLDRIVCCNGGQNRFTKGIILQPIYGDSGYYRVKLCNNKTQKILNIHRLVAKAFIDHPKNKYVVNHKDCDKSNNNLNNLEWCTTRENIDHAVKNGRYLRGEKLPHAKLNEFQVRVIKKSTELGHTLLGEIFKVHKSTIYLIRKRKNWKHI